MPAHSSRAFGNDSDAYERYMGRWSRLVAGRFLDWLAVPASCEWLDVGSGTGNLSQAVLSQCDPAGVHGIEPSPGFVERARDSIRDQRASFETGDAGSLPVESAIYDAVVSGLVLNFIPDANGGIAEMVRAVRPGGTVAAYVWDYAGKMEIMRQFWDVATTLDPAASGFDEGRREPPLCNPEVLTEHFAGVGLTDVEVRTIDVEAHFADFDDYWGPFTGQQGSAPGYLMSLDEDSRNLLKEHLRTALPVEADGSIDLIARAWAVRGVRSGG